MKIDYKAIQAGNTEFKNKIYENTNLQNINW